MNRTERFEALDSLRGICACVVALLHLPSTSAVSNSLFIRNGWMFVDFFFVLSGFVIACGYGTRLASGYSIGRFLFLRLGRIYPLHLAIMLLLLLFQLSMMVVSHRSAAEVFSGNYAVDAGIGSVLLLQIFGFWSNLSWNGPSWSIAAEMLMMASAR